jgi:dihydrofolate reductase
MVVHSFDQAVAACQDQQEAFVIGGEAVFREALPRTKRLHLTRVHANIEGDAYFPETDLADWKLLDQEHHSEDERNDYAFTFYVYERP